MIINPSAPGGYTIFCDDIRHEVSGKTTFVGVYNNHLIVSGDAPVTLPQLCMYVVLRLYPPEKQVSPIIRIFRSDQEAAICEMTAEIEPANKQAEPLLPIAPEPDSATFLQLGFNVNIPSFVVENPFILKVRAFIDDDEIRLGALQVTFAKPSTAETEH